VTQQFLQRANVVVGFQEVGGKAVAQSVGSDRFDDAGQAGCLFNRLVQAALVQVVAAHNARSV